MEVICCAKCGKKFTERAGFVESESRCGTLFPVKCIKTRLFLDGGDDIEILEYPDALWRCGDMIELFHYVRGFDVEFGKLDTVIYDKDIEIFYVYTNKFDVESEEKFVKMLLERREIELKKYFEQVRSRVQDQICRNETLINCGSYKARRVKDAARVYALQNRI